MTEIKLITDKKIWEEYVLSSPDCTFLQSWNWGVFNQNLGAKIFRWGFFKQNKLEGVALLIKKKAKRGAYLECPGGPLLDFKSQEFFPQFCKAVFKLARQEKCFFLRVRPQLKDNQENRLLFKKQGFLNSPMHLHAQQTWQLDLTKTEEELLREMRKSTRYLVKKSLKENFGVEQSLDLNDVDKLYKLQMETVARQKFVPFSLTYFQEEFKAFKDDDQIRLFKISFKGRVLAAAFIIFYGKTAYYHYSGTSFEAGNIPSSYRLQWEVIKEAIKRGLKVYDLWGVAPDNKPDHRFAGVSLFKKGFGGYGVNYLPAQDLPVSSFYWLTYFFESLRKVSRRL